MKLISELNVGGMLRAGCTCSEGRTKTRGLWDNVIKLRILT